MENEDGVPILRRADELAAQTRSTGATKTPGGLEGGPVTTSRRNAQVLSGFCVRDESLNQFSVPRPNISLFVHNCEKCRPFSEKYKERKERK
jgi:hypothetical protein